MTVDELIDKYLRPYIEIKELGGIEVITGWKSKDLDLKEFKAALNQLIQERETMARIDEIHKMFGYPKKGEIGYQAVKDRLKELSREQN
jgi:Ca2+-binding EF-hand superfamily protein